MGEGEGLRGKAVLRDWVSGQGEVGGEGRVGGEAVEVGDGRLLQLRWRAEQVKRGRKGDRCGVVRRCR